MSDKHFQLEINTHEVHERHARAYAKRQLQDAGDFADNHYPTFYGGDFSNVIPVSASYVQARIQVLTYILR